MEMKKISNLYNFAYDLYVAVDFRVISKNDQLVKKLYGIVVFLRSVQMKLQEMGGLGCLDKEVEKMVVYGLRRMEFFVNETMLYQLQGNINEDYVRQLAKDVFPDVPVFSDPKRQGRCFVREVEKIEREKEMEQIAGLLLLDSDNDSSPMSVVPIIGMAGTGKTSLARLLYYDQRVEKHFSTIHWLEISGVSTDIRILRDIVREYPELLGSSIDDHVAKYSMKELVSILQILLNHEKYLLILDDLSNDISGKWVSLLEPLLSACANCKPGSRIVVTSRSTSLDPRVLLRLPMAKNAPYLLEPLHRDESLVYFQSIAFRGIAEEDRNPHQIDIGLDIFNKCANNLHAIKIIASILSSQSSTREWQYFNEVVLNSLPNPVKRILSTVDLMPHQLLNYYSLFPLDHEFTKIELNQLWESQEQLINLEPLKETFDRVFEKLLGSEFLFECRKTDKTGVLVYYKAQLLPHELVKYLSKDDYLLLEKPTEDVDYLQLQHVSFIADCSWENPSWLHCAKQLKSLIFLPSKSCDFITVRNINVVLENFKALQALDLAVVNCRSCLDSIGKLKHLRYLKLGPSSTFLPECIINLKLLQTLDIRHSKIRELPGGFYTLRHLRHLYLGDTLIDLPPRFGELIELRTLDLFIVGQHNGLDALTCFTHLAGKLKIRYLKGCVDHVSRKIQTFLKGRKLDNLTLEWASSNAEPIADIQQKEDAKDQLEFLQPPSTLKCLTVKGWKGERFPQWAMIKFSTSLCNLVSIDIVDCNQCKHLPSFSKLRYLTFLQLRGLNALEWIDICDENSKASSSTTAYFPSLKYLMLANLPLLKGWSNVEEGKQQMLEKQQYFPQKIFNWLSELRVNGCPKLVSMPLVPSLETLEAVNLSEMLLKHLMMTQESSPSSANPALKELHINSVHKLESLAITISSLQVLTVRECKELTSVLVHSSNSLKQLKIQACGRLQDISRALHNLSVLEELYIESSEELDWADMMNDVEKVGDDSVGVASKGLRNLRFLTVTSIWKPEPLPKSLGCLRTLKELSLCWLYHISVLPESIGHLTQLSRLVIQYCPKLKKLPESFPNLKSLIQLNIKECPKLERRCKQPFGEDCNLIDHIPNVHLG